MSESRAFNARHGLSVGTKQVVNSSGILVDAGDITQLLTTSKTSLVSAINEVKNNFTSITSDQVAEGTGNLFFTTQRARDSVSVTDNGGDGSLSYSSLTGVITYTGPSATEVRAHFSAGTGVTLSSGTISIGQAVATTSNVTFNNATLSGILYGPSNFVIDPAAAGDISGKVSILGDLEVLGTTTTVNSVTLEVLDKNIVLAKDALTPTAADGGGITLAGANATISYAVNTDSWNLNKATNFSTKIGIGAGSVNAQELAWNADEGTMDLGLPGGVVNQIGQEIQLLCRNGTGSTIPNGTAVMFTGSLGNSGRLVVAPMVANGTYPGYVFFGVTTQSIAAGQDGYVTSFGKIRGVNTSAYAEGAILWCSETTPGAFTDVEPLAPNLKLPVAAVITSSNNGTLMVRADTGYRLQDLHDVDANGASQNNDVLAYNSTLDRWEHKAISVILGDSFTLNGVALPEYAKSLQESTLISRNATVSIGTPGTVPFGVGPIIPPGMSLVGIGADSYNVIDISSGSIC